MPTETRNRLAPMPARNLADSSMPTCDMVTGCAIRLSTPPKDSARVKHLSPSRNAPTAASPPRKLETQHGAEATLLAARNFMSGIVAESGIINALHGWMPRQEVHYGSGIFSVHAHARVQGANSAQREKAVERRPGYAEGVRPPHQVLLQFSGGGNHRSADHVAVAIQVLGGGVQRQIGAETQGLLPDRR